MSTTTIHYQEDGFVFSASSAEVAFSDGLVLHDAMNVTVLPSTPIGDQIILTMSDADNNEKSRVVRLILIQPSQDWRRNQTYAWKLDNAWMQGAGSVGWLHWNVESNINSAIQVPDDNRVFVSSLVEFHFSAIGMKRAFDSSVTNNKLVLKDVRIGAHLLDHGGNTDYRPCKLSATCSVVDGAVTGELGTLAKDKTYYEIGEDAVVVAAVAVVLACICYLFLRRRRRTRLYEQVISEAEDDLALDVDEEGDDAPVSTVKGVVNETG